MKKYLMTLATALCCAMTMAVLTACSDNDDNPADPTPGDGGKNNYVWIIIVVVVAVVIIGVVILIVCLKKKRVYSSEIDKKDINELSMPLE